RDTDKRAWLSLRRAMPRSRSPRGGSCEVKPVRAPMKRPSDRLDASVIQVRDCGSGVERDAQLNPIRGGESIKGRISRGFPQIGVSTLPIFYCPSHLFPRFLLPLLPSAFATAVRAVRPLGRCGRRAQECESNCMRWFGPTRATDIGLRADVVLMPCAAEPRGSQQQAQPAAGPALPRG